jgi:hypothetical protein
VFDVTSQRSSSVLYMKRFTYQRSDTPAVFLSLALPIFRANDFYLRPTRAQTFDDFKYFGNFILKVPKREIFDRSDFPDFYTIKSLHVDDFGVKIKKKFTKYLGVHLGVQSSLCICSVYF